MISDKLCICGEENFPDFDVFMNKECKIIFIESSEMGTGWFSLDKEDWGCVKNFIDAQFKAIEQKGKQNG